MLKSAKKEFTGRHMLIIILAFFGVVLLANGTLVVVALTNWNGLVVPNGYVASQKYNAAAEQARIRAASGWQGHIETGEGGRPVLRLYNGKGDAIAGRQPQVHAARPTHENADRDLVLQEIRPGVYRANESLAPGIWLLTVRVESHQGLDYAERFRLTIR